MLSKPPGESPETPDELARLPHGRHGLPPEFIAHNQRERLIASFVALVAENGYDNATITAVTEGAGVSSRTFYEYFETVEDCCLAAFDRSLEELRPLVAAAFGTETEWPLSIRAALAALLAEFSSHRGRARLLTAEPFVAGPRIATRHKAAIEEMVPVLRRGRALGAGADALPDTTERGLLGAANSMVARHLLAGEDLEELLPDLTQFCLTPYLGAAEARRVASL